ncbi:MAG: alpha-N-acetylglucosaminidase [Prevotella sp.]|jgi:alpha-N-acetylglucosaminidase|nr:alpha-N-acetylglucosaminidase [Prevotella sp.]MCI2088833.1 alpha-N-acetylglucosaminidase [Prevotella sp.]MCI2126277.1 alpha-N-acetylglucosaminidase [Prevotella sp.]
MKKISCLFFFFLFLDVQTFATNESAAVMRGMVNRLFPKYARSFVFVVKEDSGKDCFSLRSERNKIVISGNDANSMAVGLNYYLKNFCRTTVTWFKDDPVEMPETLPEVTGIVRSSAKVPDRFFLNYCTFGYTMPWWKWSDWEHFIDWMALNGINMPLAITGQEAIWYQVWRKLGLTDKEIRSYFTGPAHLPWHRMCNIDGWQGPLPMDWIEEQKALQKLIVTREREFNMRPVLPAFSGHIPAALKRIYPHLRCTPVSQWGGFSDDYRCTFLDPGDSLYRVIQKAYLNEQTRIYGTDHIYGIDPFNEVNPPSWDEKVLSTYARQIYRSLSSVDPKAVWLQMGWLFYNDQKHWTPSRIRAYLRGVPQDRLILLDYFCDFKEVWKGTDRFYGQPYIWCYLGNFGGNSMLAGNMKDVSWKVDDVMRNGGDNFKGIGSTLEGFDMNEFMYEYLFSKAWDPGQGDDAYIRQLADSRTGRISPAARQAWSILCNKVYVQPASCCQSILVNARPCLTGYGSWKTDTRVSYAQADLLSAWRLLLSVKGCNRNTLAFDDVNIGRQVLGNYFQTVRDEFSKAYRAGDLSMLQNRGAKMKAILSDMERLLDCHPSFSLKKWISGARDMGKNPEEKDYYERNARTLITVWGDSPSLTDYANRAWAELTDQYYAVRWNHFIDEVIDAVRAGQPFDEKKFLNWSLSFERQWIEPSHVLKYHEGGNGITVAREIYAKYAHEINPIRLN